MSIRKCPSCSAPLDNPNSCDICGWVPDDTPWAVNEMDPVEKVMKELGVSRTKAERLIESGMDPGSLGGSDNAKPADEDIDIHVGEPEPEEVTVAVRRIPKKKKASSYQIPKGKKAPAKKLPLEEAKRQVASKTSPKKKVKKVPLDQAKQMKKTKAPSDPPLKMKKAKTPTSKKKKVSKEKKRASKDKRRASKEKKAKAPKEKKPKRPKKKDLLKRSKEDKAQKQEADPGRIKLVGKVVMGGAIAGWAASMGIMVWGKFSEHNTWLLIGMIACGALALFGSAIVVGIFPPKKD